MSRQLVMAVAIGVAVAASGIGQEVAEPPPPQGVATPLPMFADRVEVRVANVDVTVLDENGAPVAGLARDDFVVLVDSGEREITNFSAFAGAPAAAAETGGVAVTSEQAGPGAGGTAPPKREPVFLVILVDNENVSLFNRNHLLTRIKDFVTATVTPGDMVTVITNDRGLRVVCPLTTDTARVLASVDQQLSTSAGVGGATMFLRIGERQIREIYENREPNMLDRMMVTARVNANQIMATARMTVRNLEALVRSLSGLPGRRAVLYVSDGLPMIPGRELFTLITDLIPELSLGQTDMKSYYAAPLYDELSNFALAADVTMHTVDARGLVGPSGADAERRYRQFADIDDVAISNYQDPLIFLAARTGGVSVVNTNKFAERLEVIGATLASSYSLGFTVGAEEGDVMHHVKVGLKREGKYVLHYRPTFVARTTKTQVADRTAAGMLFDLADDPLGIRVRAGVPRSSGKKTRLVPVRILVPMDRVVMVPEDQELVGAVTVFYGASSLEGRRSPLARTHHSVRVPVAGASAIGTFAIETEVEVGEGEHRISVGVLDEVSGVSGYAVVVVPGSN